MSPNDINAILPSNTGLGHPTLPHPSLGVSENVLPHIGHTPLISLSKIAAEEGLQCTLLAKCEFFSAGGSVKDRIALRNNPLAHEFGTAVEIVQQVQNWGGKVDVIVAGAGTGGTVSGIAKGLKKVWSDVHVCPLSCLN